MQRVPDICSDRLGTLEAIGVAWIPTTRASFWGSKRSTRSSVLSDGHEKIKSHGTQTRQLGPYR